jgi:hypothetical protein
MGRNAIPVRMNAAITYFGSSRGCQDLILCCVNAVSEGMRLLVATTPSAAGSEAEEAEGGAEVEGCDAPPVVPSVDDWALGIAVGEIILLYQSEVGEGGGATNCTHSRTIVQ